MPHKKTNKQTPKISPVKQKNKEFSLGSLLSLLTRSARLFRQLAFKFYSLMSSLARKREYPLVSLASFDNKKPINLAALRVSSQIFYGTFLTLVFLMGGLLYGACFRVSHMTIVLPPINPNAALERDVRKVVSGYPIEEMTAYIAEHDKVTAAFLVGIAKKESNWGKRVPRSKDGADCYNYWGYRGAGSRGIAMGHGCFGSREEAISIVGDRIDTLVKEYKFDTPAELIVWKCGWSCAGHSPKSVKKWISDVGFYFEKVNN